MARILLCILLLSAVLGFSQQPQTQDPPPTTPPASAGNSQPPAQPAPQEQSMAGANTRIQNSVQDLLSSDPILSGVDVQASVNDQSIILTGTVQSYVQHQRVLQLVSSYGRWRRIEDKLKMQ